MDKYDKIKKIGEGSFGKALLVRKKDDGKFYVVKEVNTTKVRQIYRSRDCSMSFSWSDES